MNTQSMIKIDSLLIRIDEIAACQRDQRSDLVTHIWLRSGEKITVEIDSAEHDALLEKLATLTSQGG